MNIRSRAAVDERTLATPLSTLKPLQALQAMLVEVGWLVVQEGWPMPQFRTIEIDFDVHKLIEEERRGFDDQPIAVLRRLLGLPDKPESPEPKAVGRVWSDVGCVLPHGTLVRMNYGGQLIEGEILDGKWVCGGQSFDTPSAAASALARTKDGNKTTLNGWNYWQAKLPGSESWEPIKSFRMWERHLAAQNSPVTRRTAAASKV